MKKQTRITLRTWEWCLYLICDIYTTSAIIWYDVTLNNPHTIALISTILTLVRVAFFLYLCCKLAGSKVFTVLLIPDQIMLCGLVSTVTYAFFNFSIKIGSALYNGLLNTTCFFLLMLSISGVLRAMVAYMQWTKAKVILYKSARAFGIFYYLVFALVNTYQLTINPKVYHAGLYVWYVLLNLGYVETLYAVVAFADGIAFGQLKFMIGEPPPSSRDAAQPLVRA